MSGTIIEVIAELVIDFFNIREWRLRKKAKAEGKKKPFPIFTLIISMSGILIIFLVLIKLWISWPFVFIPDTQIDEMDSIVTSLNKYRDNHGTYPENIKLIVHNVPIRKGWLSDCWGSEYTYIVLNDGEDFELRSSGRDKKIGSKDDLIRTSK